MEYLIMEYKKSRTLLEINDKGIDICCVSVAKKRTGIQPITITFLYVVEKEK